MKRSRLIFSLCVGILLSFLLTKLTPFYVHGSDTSGGVDSSFSNFVVGPDYDVNTIATYNDGRILIGGYFDNYNNIEAHAVARINQDGALDNSFTSGLPSNFYATHVEILDNGKILVRGEISSTGYIYRLNSDGSLDNSFNTISLGMASLDTTNFVVQPDGKIITVYSSDSIIRLNADGTQDSTWSLLGTDLVVYKIVATTNDSFLVAGNPAIGGDSQDGIIRIDKDGNLDNSFLNGNIGLGGIFNGINDVEIDSEGYIWISGSFTEYHGILAQNIAKLNPDGTLNSTFQSSLSSDSYEIDKLVIQPDGRILAGGYIYAPTDEDYRMIVRLNADGTKDTTFDSGYNSTDYDYICDMQLMDDNKLLIGGYFENYNGGTMNNLVQINLGAYLDINAPTGSISINSGASTTTTQNVTLTLNASDDQSGLSQMIICQNSSFTGCSWEPYKTSKSLILTSENGLKTVYAKYKDASGNISLTYMDTILLSIPEISVKEPSLINTSSSLNDDADSTDTNSSIQNNLVLKIVDQIGKPIVGALVTLESGDTGYTNSDGIVEFENIPIGKQEVNISYQGHNIVTSTDVLGTETYESPSQIAINVDETSDTAQEDKDILAQSKSSTWLIATLLGLVGVGVLVVFITRKKTK